jgi:hypothetical protein
MSLTTMQWRVFIVIAPRSLVRKGLWNTLYTFRVNKKSANDVHIVLLSTFYVCTIALKPAPLVFSDHVTSGNLIESAKYITRIVFLAYQRNEVAIEQKKIPSTAISTQWIFESWYQKLRNYDEKNVVLNRMHALTCNNSMAKFRYLQHKILSLYNVSFRSQLSIFAWLEEEVMYAVNRNNQHTNMYRNI